MKKKHFDHPSCWVAAPEVLPPNYPMTEKLKTAEVAAAKQGFKVRLVVFDTEPVLTGIAVFPATQRQPTAKQLCRIYRASAEFHAFMAMQTDGGVQ